MCCFILLTSFKNNKTKTKTTQEPDVAIDFVVVMEVMEEPEIITFEEIDADEWEMIDQEV